MPERIGHRTLTKYRCKKRSRTRERVQRYAKGTPSTTHNEAPTPGISTQRVSAAPNQHQTNRGWNAPAHDTDEGSKSISTVEAARAGRARMQHNLFGIRQNAAADVSVQQPVVVGDQPATSSGAKPGAWRAIARPVPLPTHTAP